MLKQECVERERKKDFMEDEVVEELLNRTRKGKRGVKRNPK